ncbi:MULTISPECIES: alginate export family protein [Flavobacterium]|uniref:alginate export family protein n=1 Tax=Flavobacterium TaxID=237 RepID=UPI001FCA75FB|nr:MULTISPECIES: alginate export family protein [Flavobacterium]UOK42637.1 alginate export family protein [Flavobacterium enshiense]
MKAFKKISLSFFAMVGIGTYAQEFNADLQLRPRYEYRNGYKAPLKYGELPTSFVSQRTRLKFDFKLDQFSTKISLQNIRTWGDVPTTATADKNGVALFEAWGQYDFTDKWSARFGRQVIAYDNERIMGEIDWLQQGQSHDALLVSYHPANHRLDLGAAYNANAENLTRPVAPYTTNYKTFQYGWYHTNISKVGLSLLLLNTGYEYQKTATTLKTDYKQTFGTYLTFKNKAWDANLGIYGQSGKDTNNKVNGFYAGALVGYAFDSNFKLGAGYEYFSGKDQNDTSTDIKSFYPLFGTNHAFNGYMDYFYVGGNHKNSVGLQDAYLKLTYAKNKWQFNLMPHAFAASASVIDTNGEKMDSYLGTEIDFTAGYQLHKFIAATGGFSQMFGTSTMNILKGGNNVANNNWAWFMININPRIFSAKQPQPNQ